MKSNNREDNNNDLLASAINEMYSSIDIPDGETAWRRMQTRLMQQQKRSHRKRVFKIGIAIAGFSLIIGTSATSPKESYASMQSLFAMVKDAKQGLVNLLFGENRPKNTEGAKTLPPPDTLGSESGHDNHSISSTLLGESGQAKETALETARNKLDYKIRAPEHVPHNFSLLLKRSLLLIAQNTTCLVRG
ncbi:hypothetical protein BBD42_03655 [Paenibacillus sp. BIHB 4019]|uniref:Uncharacterized protein n=1 Tax=Paenibacillus sp. BIHB 4019 TaxID=1870819 RepID=A0A1B2DD69_9BACL|nr:hypothetical protein [Paenibacillus sp. BIHB 4019]ANY65657.1 hypothetical protein BBD42_03655 [Paenibacillus sp. BIHB 4019]